MGGSSHSLVQDNILAFCHFAALTGKVTEICHSSQKFLLNAEEGNILFILNILACELNLNIDTSGSSGRILTGHISTDFETRKFKLKKLVIGYITIKTQLYYHTVIKYYISVHIKAYIGETLKYLSSYVLVLIDGVGLTSYKFYRGHPVV